MTWPPSLYVVALWLIAAALVALAGVSWRTRVRTRGARSFAFFTLAAAVWALAEGMQAAFVAPQAQLTWLQLKYLGIATLPVGFLVFANDYTRQTAWLNRFVVASLLVLPAVTIGLAWTYPLQDVLWRSVEAVGGRLETVRGPWFWVHTGSSYLWLALGSFYLLRGYVGTPRGYRAQVTWVLVAVAVPWVANAAVVFAGVDLPVDPTPLTFAVSAFAFAQSLFSHRLLDIVPVARETVMRHLADPILVFDPRQRVLQANPAATELLEFDAPDDAVGRGVAELFHDQPELVRAFGSDELVELDLAWSRDGFDHHLHAQITPLADRRGRHTGHLLRLQDIGRQVLAERTLREAERRLAEQQAYLTALQEVTNGLAARRPVGELLEVVLRRAAEAVGAPHGFVHLVSRDGAMLERHCAVGRFLDLPDLLFRSGEGLSGRAWAERRAFAVPDYPAWNGKLRGIDLDWARAAIAVPLATRSEVLGVLALVRPRDDRRPFSGAEEALLVSFARLGTIALENVRLIEELEARRREADQLARIGTAMQEPTSLQERLDLLLHAIQQVVGFDRAVVWLPTEDGRALRTTSWTGFGADVPGGAHEVPLDGSVPLLEATYRDGEEHVLDSDLPVPERWRARGPAAALALLRSRAPAVLPLVSRGRTVGVLAVDDAYRRKAMGDKLPVLRRFATSAAVAIDSALLHEEAQRELIERRAAEAQLRRSEEALREAKEAAEAANASKSAFLANVSHELRTPLTSILGFARLIERRFDEALAPALEGHPDRKVQRALAQARGNAGIIYAESQRLTHLINDVLDLAKIEAGRVDWKMAPTDLAEVLGRAAQATHGLFEQKPGVTLELDAPDGLPAVVGDRDRLTQVVINLISNAVKFTPRGRVGLSLRREVDPLTGDALVVRVRDTGVGIAPEDHATVFEQFRQVGDTLTEKPQGTGLGLPICKEIVEHHGGRMWVESALGAGATFVFALPLGGAEAAVAAVDAAAAAPVAPHATATDGARRLLGPTLRAAEAALRRRVEALVKRTLGGGAAPGTLVLVVDDDAQIRALLRQELEEAGHQVVEAADGRAALAAVAARRPDLVVLDVMMPELTGFDVAAVLKGDPATASVPIVILSVVQDEARGARLGVARYFTKPVDVRALVAEVGAVLRDAAAGARTVVVDPPDAAPEDRELAGRVRVALHEAGFAVEVVVDPAAALAGAAPDLLVVAADVARGSGLEAAARAAGVEVVAFQ